MRPIQVCENFHLYGWQGRGTKTIATHATRKDPKRKVLLGSLHFAETLGIFPFSRSLSCTEVTARVATLRPLWQRASFFQFACAENMRWLSRLEDFAMVWTLQQRLAVWNKGKIVPNNDASEWRKDACNAWIGWSHYGNRDSQYGWEIDHIDPDGGDNLSNLRPLQWENNVAKSDGRLACAVTANGKDNR